ncbi:hypothetical protein CTheo_6627 [Ceratobasidium theobromae]|uniref:Uncharacterized protein n=1 Tax=Ceratobasidium theobromae TaxID=1582974 RepID=A0A5N5QEP9_9AGAM|nr:hypothetical protein CTheo_6627 [Ceratobasidium theobromae]
MESESLPLASEQDHPPTQPPLLPYPQAMPSTSKHTTPNFDVFESVDHWHPSLGLPGHPSSLPALPEDWALCYMVLYVIRCARNTDEDKWILDITQAHLHTRARRKIQIHLCFSRGQLESVFVANGCVPVNGLRSRFVAVVEMNKADCVPPNTSPASVRGSNRIHTAIMSILRELAYDPSEAPDFREDESGGGFFLEFIKRLVQYDVLSKQDEQKALQGTGALRCRHFPHSRS